MSPVTVWAEGKGPPEDFDYRTDPKQEREPDDWYVEEPWVTELLLEREHFAGTMVDPCAGMGNICRAWAEAERRDPWKAQCWGLDLRERSELLGDADNVPMGPYDFLADDWIVSTVGSVAIDNMIFNPPFLKDLPILFIQKARSLVRHKVAALLPSKWLHGATDKRGRYKFFTETQPSAIYHLSSRPSMPPGPLLVAGTIKAKGGKVDYSWIVWTRGHRGPAATYWVRRPGHEKPLRGSKGDGAG